MKLNLRGLDDPPRPLPNWLVDGVLPATGLVTIAGPPGCGKSLATAGLALAVAGGGQWLGRPTRQGGVLYVSAEAADSTEARVRALAAVATDPNPPVVFARGEIDLIDKQAAADIFSAVDAAEHRLRQRLRLIVVDALGSATRGADENSSRDMGRALGALLKVAAEKQLLVVLIAHVAKAGDDLRVRGNGCILADVDAHLAITGGDSTKTLVVLKQRDGDPGLKIKFRITADAGPLRIEVAEGNAKTGTAPRQPRGDALTALMALSEDLGGEAPIDAWRAATTTRFGDRGPAAIRNAWSYARRALIDGGFIEEIEGDRVRVRQRKNGVRTEENSYADCDGEAVRKCVRTTPLLRGGSYASYAPASQDLDIPQSPASVRKPASENAHGGAPPPAPAGDGRRARHRSSRNG